MNLVEVLDGHAQATPTKDALIGGTTTLTYAQLCRDAAQMAAALEDQGLQPGSRVLIFVPMSIDLYVLLLGVLRLGAVAVFVDPGMGRPQIEAALDLARPDAFVAIPKAHLLRLVSPALRRVRLKRTAAGMAKRARKAGRARALEAVPEDAPALLTFTSGSTGRPKGVMRSHGFLLTQHRALTEAMGTRADDIEMPALPIFLLNTLAVGATAVIPPIGVRVADADPAALAAAIQTHGVTTTAASPALYEGMPAWCERTGTRFETLRHIYLGGAPVTPALLAALEPLVPNGSCMVVYGSTEAEPIAHLEAKTVLEETAKDTAAGRGLCVGPPIDSVRIRIVNDELLVAGGHVNESYFENPEAEAKTKVKDPDGTVWHRTGDAVRQDEHGRLWLLGRCDHVVSRGARRVFPFSVELAARALDGVTRAALLDHRARVLLAYEGLADETALKALDPIIDRVVKVKKMPTDPRHNAKVDRKALKAQLG